MTDQCQYKVYNATLGRDPLHLPDIRVTLWSEDE